LPLPVPSVFSFNRPIVTFHSRPLRFLLILLTLGAFSVSCRFFSKDSKEGEGALARAYGYYLYPEELNGVVPKNASRQDSISITRSFIENWIRKKAVLRKAEDNLDDDQKDVSRQLEEYRNSLLTYAYEAELIRQRLDTSVTDEEVAAYYERNKKNFELKDNIIRVVYLRLAKNSPKLDKVRQWYRSEDKRDRRLLEEYCHQYAMNYYLDDESWLLFDDLLKEIPIKTYDKEQFLQNNRVIEFEADNFVYLVNIKGFRIRNSLSPLGFERNNIRTMIINERKLKVVEEMERQAYEDARKKGDAEVF
jgi:Fe-S cluster biosynthesis and repair protein YggX